MSYYIVNNNNEPLLFYRDEGGCTIYLTDGTDLKIEPCNSSVDAFITLPEDDYFQPSRDIYFLTGCEGYNTPTYTNQEKDRLENHFFDFEILPIDEVTPKPECKNSISPDRITRGNAQKSRFIKALSKKSHSVVDLRGIQNDSIKAFERLKYWIDTGGNISDLVSPAGYLVIPTMGRNVTDKERQLLQTYLIDKYKIDTKIKFVSPNIREIFEEFLKGPTVTDEDAKISMPPKENAPIKKTKHLDYNLDVGFSGVGNTNTTSFNSEYSKQLDSSLPVAGSFPGDIDGYVAYQKLLSDRGINFLTSAHLFPTNRGGRYQSNPFTDPYGNRTHLTSINRHELLAEMGFQFCFGGNKNKIDIQDIRQKIVDLKLPDFPTLMGNSPQSGLNNMHLYFDSLQDIFQDLAKQLGYVNVDSMLKELMGDYYNSYFKQKTSFAPDNINQLLQDEYAALIAGPFISIKSIVENITTPQRQGIQTQLLKIAENKVKGKINSSEYNDIFRGLYFLLNNTQTKIEEIKAQQNIDACHNHYLKVVGGLIPAHTLTLPSMNGGGLGGGITYLNNNDKYFLTAQMAAYSAMRLLSDVTPFDWDRVRFEDDKMRVRIFPTSAPLVPNTDDTFRGNFILEGSVMGGTPIIKNWLDWFIKAGASEDFSSMNGKFGTGAGLLFKMNNPEYTISSEFAWGHSMNGPTSNGYAWINRIDLPCFKGLFAFGNNTDDFGGQNTTAMQTLIAGTFDLWMISLEVSYARAYEGNLFSPQHMGLFKNPSSTNIPEDGSSFGSEVFAVGLMLDLDELFGWKKDKSSLVRLLNK